MKSNKHNFLNWLLAISLSLVVYDTIAATITVDGSTCTLANAITSANSDTATSGCAAGSGDDTINFNSTLSGQTITLASALPSIASNITIDGSALASHVKISGNNAYRVFNITSGTVVLTHLDLINGNDGNNAGGGIKNAGTLTINNSTLANNYSGPGFSGGGGIYNDGGILTINNSTFSGNTAAGSAGGIYNYTGTLTVNNSTFSGNSVGGGSSGGGVANWGTGAINNSTFSGNSAGSNGGGIQNFSGTLTVKNSILANNGSKDCSGSIATATNNLIQSTGATACNLTNGTNGNKIGVDPLLGALADNGGSTQTMAISSSSSPAVNGGDSGTCLTTDQRGNARVGICDIGAYESSFGTVSAVSASVESNFTLLLVLLGTIVIAALKLRVVHNN